MSEQGLLLCVVAVIGVYLVLMFAHKLGRCPKCNNQMHRMIDSNTWMCENDACRYAEIRRGGHG